EDDMPTEDEVLKFDGTLFYFESDLMSDSAIHVISADSALYSDTVFYAFKRDYADTSIYSFFGDSVSFAQYIKSVYHADSVQAVDSSNISLFSIGNWGISGNSGLVDTN